MTRSNQDADEARWIEAMVELLGLELLQAPAQQRPPRPDFALTLVDGKRVAVEIVEAMDEAVRKGYSGSRKLIVRLVEEHMKARGLTAIVTFSIPVGFLPTLGKLTSTSQREIATNIVDTVGAALASRLESGKHGWIFTDNLEDRPPRSRLQLGGDLCSRRIKYLRWLAVYASNDVRVGTGTGGMAAGPRLIQTAIDRKSAKRGKYDLANVDALWLLIVGSTGTGGALGIHHAEANNFISPFAETIFLECWEKKCVRLKTTPPSS